MQERECEEQSEKVVCELKNDNLIGEILISNRNHILSADYDTLERRVKKKCDFNDSTLPFASFLSWNDKLKGIDKDVSNESLSVKIFFSSVVFILIDEIKRKQYRDHRLHSTNNEMNDFIEPQQRNGIVKCPVGWVCYCWSHKARMNANFIQIKFKWIIQLNGRKKG